MPYKKILISVDSSEYSLNAVKTGFSLAKELQATAALIFVIDELAARGSLEAGLLPADALAMAKKEAEQTLDELARMNGDREVLKFMPVGSPEADVIKTAEEWQADLLVVGTHSRTGINHLLLGSVAEHIVRHSKIPVVVVPSRK